MTDPITKEYVDTKSALIRAGLKELKENGYNNFSIRRVAADCGISCAAPYRHFKNKSEFVLEIFRYINREWYLTQNVILSEYEDDKERLIEISVSYVRFLVDHPDFFAIMMLSIEGMGEEERVRIKSGVNTCVRGLIENYCKRVGMSDTDRDRKMYIIRSIIMGGAWMILNEEIEKPEQALDFVRSSVAREFDIE